MTVALDLARCIHGIRYENLPEEAVRWAKTAIIDTLGVALAGAKEPCTELVERVVTADGICEGPCLVLGGSARMRSLDATLINGTAAHALDYDDTSKTMSGHLSAVVVPAVFALGEQLGADGKRIIEAYVAGFETGTGIGRGVNFYHYEKGWHPTATLGVFGAAAACARLLDLTEEQTAAALAICVSQSCGVKANFGSMTKPLHVGIASRNALFAALLAKQGFTASSDAFEHEQGFFEMFNGVGNYSAQKITENWGKPFDILKNGISIKQYPCVYSTHAAVDAAILLREKYSLTPERIKSVEVCMHQRRLLPHVTRHATSGLNAKFCLPYIIARALLNGRIMLEHFKGDAYAEAGVQDMMARITYKPHTDEERDYSGSVTVFLQDDSNVSESVVSPRGRGPENPLTDEDVKRKFEDCASRLLPLERARSLYGRLRSLEDADSVAGISSLLSV